MKDLSFSYEVDSLIGRGVLGLLHGARQVSLDRRVLIRFVSPEIVERPDVREGLLADLRTLGRLQDRGVVRTIDQGEFDGRLYYALELVDGMDLDQLENGEVSSDFYRRFPRLRHEERLEIVLEFLRNLIGLEEEGFDLRGLDTREVLLSPPFLFSLSEPCLSWKYSRAVGARHRRATGVERIVEGVLRIALDLNWDSAAAPKASRSSGREHQLLAEIRQEIFSSVSTVSTPSSGDFVRHVIRILEERKKSSRQPQSKATRVATSFSDASESRRMRTGTRGVYSGVLATLITIGAALFAYPWLAGDNAPSSEQEHLANAARAEGSLDQLLSLQAGASIGTDSIATAVEETVEMRADEVARGAMRSFFAGREEFFEGLLPGGVESVEAKELLRARAQPLIELIQVQTENLRELFNSTDLERRLQQLDLLVSHRHRLDEAYLRIVLLALLDDPEPQIRNRAATCIGAGLAGSPPHLDLILEDHLRRQQLDSKTALALVGYFAQRSPERSEPVLLNVALEPFRDCSVANPDGNSWTVQLFRLLHGTEDVLAEWTGSQSEDSSQRRMRLREAAFLALDHSGSQVPLERARQFLQSTHLKEAAARIIETHATEIPLDELVDFYSQNKFQRNRIRLPLLRALSVKAPEEAFRFVIDAMAEAGLRNESRMAFLKLGLSQGMFTSADNLREVLKVVRPGFMREFADLIPDEPTIEKNLPLLLEDEDPVGLNAALGLGFSGRSEIRALDRLREAAEHPDDDPGISLGAVEALAKMRHSRATATILGILEDDSRQVSYRLHALSQVWRMLRDYVPEYQTRLVEPPDDPSSESILRTLRNLIDDSEPTIAAYAMEVLSLFEHRLAVDGMRWVLSNPSSLDAVDTAVGYFTNSWDLLCASYLDQEDQREILDELRAILQDDDYPPDTKENIVEHLVVVDTERESLQFLIEPLPKFADSGLELDAMRYFEACLDDDSVEEALLDLLMFGSSPSVSRRARDLLEQMGSSQAPELYREILSDESNPSLLFGVSEALLARGEIPEYRSILRGLLLSLRGARIAPTTTTSSFYEESGSEDVLLLLPADFTDALADWIIDMDFEADEMVGPLGLLVLRFQAEDRDPVLLRQIFNELEVSIDSVLEAFEAASSSLETFSATVATGSVVLSNRNNLTGFIWTDRTPRILDYLCKVFPKNPTTWKVHGRHALRAAGLQDESDSFTTSYLTAQTRRELLTGAVRDFQNAINLGDPDRLNLKLDLAHVHLSLGDLEDAVRLFEDYLAKKPGDLATRHYVADQLIVAGDLKTASRILGQAPRAGTGENLRAEWSKRRVELTMLDEDPSKRSMGFLRLLNDRDLQLDEANRLKVLGPGLRLLWQAHRDDPASTETTRDRLAPLFLETLTSDFRPSSRAAAAFHLGWSGDASAVPVLERIAREDLSEFVRAQCLHTLFLMDPARASEVSRELLGDGAPLVRQVAVWVLTRTDPEIASGKLTEWIQAERQRFGQDIETRRVQALGLMVTLNHSGCIDATADLVENFPGPGTRARACTALGWMGWSGHEVDHDVLRRAWRYDEDQQVRLCAGRALARAGDEEISEHSRSVLRRYRQGGLGVLRSEQDLAESLYYLIYDGSDATTRELEKLSQHESRSAYEIYISNAQSPDGTPSLQINLGGSMLWMVSEVSGARGVYSAPSPGMAVILDFASTVVGTLDRTAQIVLGTASDRQPRPEKSIEWEDASVSEILEALASKRRAELSQEQRSKVFSRLDEAVKLQAAFPFFEGLPILQTSYFPTSRMATTAGMTGEDDIWIFGTETNDLYGFFGGALPDSLADAVALRKLADGQPSFSLPKVLPWMNKPWNPGVHHPDFEIRFLSWLDGR